MVCTVYGLGSDHTRVLILLLNISFHLQAAVRTTPAQVRHERGPQYKLPSEHIIHNGQASSADRADLTYHTQSYVVQRKMPMPLGRHERILSLDNDYIHIMPSETKLVSGPVRTASYHISQVANCKTSRRVPSSFKLIVWRDKDKGDVKRYDFEAGSGRMAAEIAATVQALMQAYKEGLEREAQLSQQYQ